MNDRAILRHLFDAAVRAADPAALIPAHAPTAPSGRLIVVGAGKAAAAMAAAFEATWDGPLYGLVVTRYGHGAPTRRIEVLEAAHPVPDAAGFAASRRILALAESAAAGDLVVALISGGGSSLLTYPAEGISLEDKQALNAALLASGAPIDEMNAVRKHVSAIKGGRLAAAAHPARVLTLAISDVPGDDPEVIASGPTVADPTRFEDARDVLSRRGVEPPASIAAHLKRGADETPKPGDPRLAGAEFRLIAAPSMSLGAAADAAKTLGLAPRILGDALEGEAARLGEDMAATALVEAASMSPGDPPLVLLSGGETTVTLKPGEKPSGRGGRNVEFLLGFARAIAGREGVTAIACDTDGVDGMEEIAGAVVDPGTPARARAAGVDLADALARHDGHGFFEATGDQIVTGPTLTNVNDFRAVLIRR